MKNLTLGEGGFTLVEMLIASLLTVIVAAATMEFYVSQHKAWLVETEVADIQQNARAVLDEIASRLRMGGYRVGTHPAFEAGDDSVVVYYHNDATAHLDTVAYFVDVTDPARPALMRQYNSGSIEPFAENVESLGMNIISPRLIELSLTARANSPDSSLIDGDGYRRRTLTSQVLVRNL